MQIRKGSWTDFDTVYALIRTPESRPDWLRTRWEMPSFEPEHDLWLAEDGGVEAFAAFYAPDEAVARGNTAHIPALLERLETRARAREAPKLFFVLPEWDEQAVEAYRAAGFAPATRVLEMERDLSQEIEPPGWPEGIRVRTYTGDDAAEVKGLLDEAYLGWDTAYVPMQLADWTAWMTGDASFDPECWWLAESDGALAGVCLTWREGWVKDLATTPAWRGRGLGKALLLHALGEHRRRGNARMGLKVDTVNPTAAIPLYEKAGFRTIKTYVVVEKRL